MNQYKETKGNLTLLVLVDSSKKQNYIVFERTVLSALEHFGIPYQILDLANKSLTMDEVNRHCGIVIGEENLGKCLSSETIKILIAAIKEGIGLVSFDGALFDYPSSYLDILSIELKGIREFSSLKISFNNHPLTDIYELNKLYKLNKPLEIPETEVKKNNTLLLETEEGLPAVFVSRYGKGRIVQYTFSPKFWLPEYFGHLRGLDGLFWKSIVYIARKPFIIKAMPPFVTARIDDASGSGSIFGKKKDSANRNFAYIDILNRHNFFPSVSLFINDITKADGKIIKEKYDEELTEFTIHAFRDPKNINEFPIFMRHNGEEFSKEELKINFTQVDEKFHSWGIKHSRGVCGHFCEVGLNALSFLKERGIFYTMCPVRFGKTYVDKEARNWNPKPYGSFERVLDYMPDNPDFFVVWSAGETRPEDYVAPTVDFLYSCTPFWSESRKVDIQKAVKRGAEQIKLSLDSGFFGCLLAHEQRIATLTIKEWEQILSGIEKLTSKYRKIFKSHDYIAEYAKSRYNTKTVEANYNPILKEIKLKLIGKSTLPLKIFVYSDEESVRYESKEISPFAGEMDIISSI